MGRLTISLQRQHEVLCKSQWGHGRVACFLSHLTCSDCLGLSISHHPHRRTHRAEDSPVRHGVPSKLTVLFGELRAPWAHSFHRYGTVELLAQCHSYHFPAGGAGYQSRELRLPLVVGQNSTASCTYRCMELSCPELSMKKIIELARSCPYILLYDGPDNVSANGLLKKHISTILPRNVLYITEGCCAHLVNLCIFCSLPSQKHFVGDVHAIALACSTHGNVTTLRTALLALVGRTLGAALPVNRDHLRCSRSSAI